jgi:vacuolar-type H+-ATPase subunit E/Vma4
MRFRTGMLVGFTAGYVLGAQAGRERYEQIRRWFQKIAGSPQVQQIAERGKGAANEAGRKGLEAVQGAVSKVGTSVRERLGNGQDSDVQQIGI